MHLTPFRRLLLFMTAVLWFESFMKILPAYYIIQGMLPRDLAGATAVSFGTSLILLLLIRKGKARFLWKVSMITALLSVLFVINLRSVFVFYVSQIMVGVTMFSYWVSYNIAYFTATPKEKIGTGSAIMFSIFPILNIIAPPVAGFIFQGSQLLYWILSAVFFIISYRLIALPEDFTVHYSIRSALDEIKMTRILLILEGVWEAMVFALIPIYTLYFIKTPVSYGLYAAYLAVIGVVANLFLGHITDKLQKRVVFLYPLTILMAATTLLFPSAAKNITLWLIVTGVLNFFIPMFWNITTAMIVDTHPNLKMAMPGREISLALGRAIGLVAAAVSFFLEPTPRIIYYVLGGILFLYPMYLFWISRVKKHYAFL